MSEDVPPPGPPAPARWSAGRLVRAALCLLALAGLVGLVLMADPRTILREVSRVGWGGFALFCLPSGLIYLLDALGWRLCFERPPPVSFLRLLSIRMAGETINNTLPVAQMGGEPVKALLLERHGVPMAEGLASVIVAKAEVALAQFVFVLCGVVAALLVGGAGRQVAVGAAVMVALGLLGTGAAIVVLRRGPGRLLAALSARLGLLAGPVERHRARLERLDAALAGVYAKGPGRAWLVFVVFLAAWLLETLEVWIFARALDLPIGPLAALAIASLITVARGVGSFSPGSLGVVEGGGVLLFVAFGQTEAVALAFAVVRRARDLIWIVVGLSVLGAYGLLRPRPRGDG